MLRAVANDLLEMPHCQVVSTRDRRLAFPPRSGWIMTRVDDLTSHDKAIQQLAHDADQVIVIAPEFAGHLKRICRLVDGNSPERIGPSADFLAWTSDKQETALRLGQAGLPHPRGTILSGRDAWDDDMASRFDGPLVIKPVNGAGSLEVMIARSPGQLSTVFAAAQFPRRIETFCEGRAASVALLLGPNGTQVLQPCWQKLAESPAGAITYHGGSVMEHGPLADRARRLAQQLATRLCEGQIGYVGIDLVLGEAQDGSQDVVIEINPRLTTSYVGLRAATSVNLAEAMLAIARGSRWEISFSRLPCGFTEEGALEECAWRG